MVAQSELFYAAAPPFTQPLMLAKDPFVTIDSGPTECWTQGQFHLRRGRARFPLYPLIDPGTEQSQILTRKRLALSWRRHPHVLDLRQSRHEMNQWTFCAVARDDIHAVFSPLQRQFPAGELKSTLWACRTMTSNAGALEDGFDVTGETD